VASKGLRFAARILDVLGSGALAVGCWIAFWDPYRIWTMLAIGFLAAWAYEAITTVVLGATPGKRLLGLRVATLDHEGRPTPGTALRRGAASAALVCLPPFGWIAWAVSAFGDALGRGIPDRAGACMVVPDGFRHTVPTRSLAGFADAVRRPRLVPLGRVGDLDVRIRARLRRLTGAPVLSVAVGLLALAASLPFSTGWILLGTSVAWLVIFIVDETVTVHRRGTTPGHDLAGLAIVDRRTGAAPSAWRSFARALVLGLTLYVPVLWLALLCSMAGMRFGQRGRGLHDLAGGTVVVGDPDLDPESQRQRFMRVRQGRIG
jgi:uncharacterized RDD family membrane protein YckC